MTVAARLSGLSGPRATLLMLGLAVLCAGCLGEEVTMPVETGSEDTPAVPSPKPSSDPAPETAALSTDWESEVTLVPVSHTQWEHELEALEGRIVVVDHWATWCVPCIERFPKMLEMADRYDPEKVTFVSLSVDDRDDPDSIEQVRTFLDEQDARIPNYLMDEIIPVAFEKLDLLGIPAVHIYDASGERSYKLTGDDPNNQFTEADVEEAVRELLAER